MRNASGTALGGMKFNFVGSGAGGWVTWLSVADDGVMVCRADTYASYVRGPNDTAWRQVIRPGDNISTTDRPYAGLGGVGVAIAPTDSDVIYALNAGKVYKTTNGTATITLTTYPTESTAHPNGSYRMCGNRIAVDPAGVDVVGVPDLRGLYYTLDGGATWTLHPDIPTILGTDYNTHITFDRGSAVVGGQTQTVFVFIPGRGIYRSTTGIAGTFSLISGSPTAMADMEYAASRLHVVGLNSEGDGQYQYWNGTAWTAPSGVTGHTLTISSQNANHVFVFTAAGYRRVSTDAGSTFHAQATTKTWTGTEIPWVQWANVGYMSAGKAQFHPTLNRVMFSHGLGVHYMDSPPTDGSAYAWTNISRGIEQLVTDQINVVPGGDVMISCHDRRHFDFTRDSVGIPAGTYGVGYNALNHGSSTDYAIDDPDYRVSVAYAVAGSQLLEYGAISTNGGSSWSAFPARPAGYGGGNIAVSNAGNMVWLQSNHIQPYYTQDGGATWALCDFGTAYSASIGTGWVHAYYIQRRCVVADKENPGTFYLFHSGNGLNDAADLAMRGLWRSTDGGATFTRMRSTCITQFGYDFWNCKLRLVPGKPGHMFWCVGGVGTFSDTPTTVYIMFSKDYGVTWNPVPGPIESHDMCIGKGPVGSTYPALYSFGWISGVLGLRRMLDFDPDTRLGTWELIAERPLGWEPSGATLAGDMERFGRIYMGGAGCGQIYGDYDYRLRAS